MPSLVGNTVDKYDMLEEVGHGGMAVVYRGKDRVLEREVAVKVLHPHLADREESRLRLRREALAVAKLRHENILEIYDYSGEGADEAYIVTEFIHGPTLREWIEEHTACRPAVAALIVHRLSRALEHAHRSGIIHRDIKPENVMVREDDGCVKLMDFGIAQILDNQKLTMTGQLLGSPAYMAPELISGRPVDARTDIFAMGVLLYQLATGALPFSGRNPHEVLNRIADGVFAPASQVNPLVDPDLEAIMARCLALDPKNRYQTAHALAQDLHDYLVEIDLDPEHADLSAYFKDPDTFVADMDVRICAALVRRAEQAAGDGQASRAIALLGRCLEIDASHDRARALLDRLCRRRQRTRMLAYGAGLVGITGALALGVLFVRERLQAAPPPTVAASADPASETPPPALEPERAPSGADSPAVAGTSGGPTPPPTEPSKPATRPRVRKVLAVRGTCALKLQGVAESAAKNLRIRVGSQPPRPLAGTRHLIPMPGGKTPIKITGTRYGYSGTITPQQCRAGTVTLPVRPHPATLTFPDAPADAVIYCRACPRALGPGPFSPGTFPIVQPVPPSGTRVVLEYKHPNYKAKRDGFILLPGANRRQMNLQPK